MPSFKINNTITLDERWGPSTKFNSKDRIVDAQGHKIGVDYKGDRYQIIEKKERIYSDLERFTRGFLGTLILICTLCLALFSKSVRNLFIKSKETVRFAIKVPPITQETQQVARSMSAPKFNRMQFIHKFETAPYPISYKYHDPCEHNKNCSAYYQAERMKLKEFLKTQKPAAELLYICIGHGGVDEQVWPGFVLEQLQKGTTVHTLLFEHSKYPDQGAICILGNLMTQYNRYPRANQQLLSHLDLFSVDQFLCGFPIWQAVNWEDSTSQQEYTQGLMINTLFSKQEIDEVHTSFKSYIEHALKQGSRVVFGHHYGRINPTHFLIDTYNQWLLRYPQQLYLLWGWEGINCMTNQPIQHEDIHSFPASRSAIWKNYPRDQDGLNHCDFASFLSIR